MSTELFTIILFAAMFLILSTGLPVVFVMGAIAVMGAVVFLGFDMTANLFTTSWVGFTDQLLIACPLFLLMGSFLQFSGIADDAYDMFYKWMGGLRGGLAMASVIICAIFAAMAGVSGAATVAMGMIGIPSMIKRGYDKRLATGCITAAGPLGFLIPPSDIMILFGAVTHVSVGKLFMGGVIPGVIIAILFVILIGLRCWKNPELGPPLPPERRATWGEKLISLRAMVFPIILIFLVLGSIYLGIATPVEAAAVGAFGALICALAHRKFTWKLFHEASLFNLRLTAMIFWIYVAAICFSNLYTVMGARDMVEEMVAGLDLPPLLIVGFMQFSIIIMGMLMDDYAIILITCPIYVPIVAALGLDTLWFGILFVVNMQIAYVTPPYGFNLFYMRGVTTQLKGLIPEDITMTDIWRSVIPYIPIQLLVLVLVMIFPQLATWLPSTMTIRR